MHYTENSKQIFPEIKLRGLVPNFCIHVLYLWAIYIFPRRRNTAKKVDRLVGIYKSLTDTWMQKLGMRAGSFISGNIQYFEFSV